MKGKLFGIKICIRWDSPKKLDTSKINSLGWFAKTNLESGIKLTLEAFNNEIKTQTIRD